MWKTETKPVFIVFGPQGCGKTTQGQRLAERLKLPYIEIGKILRARSLDDPHLAQSLSKGKLAGEATLTEVIESSLAQHRGYSGLVIDGFPRNLKQGQLLDVLATEHGWRPIGLFLQLNDKTAKERLNKRYELIKGKKVKRDDDRPEVVAKRLAIFRRQTLPIANYLRHHYTLLEIDGEPPVDVVTESINQALAREGIKN